MMKPFLFCFLAFFLLSCEGRSLPPQEKPEPSPVPKVRVEREKVEKGDPLPPEVKIKLRRDDKGHTSWELSGSDADQILKVNDKLKKGLGGDSAR
jgi:hypothetical protein